MGSGGGRLQQSLHIAALFLLLAGQAYELGSDEPFTLAQLAAEISAQSGKEVRYVDLPEAEYAEALKAHGVPELMADMLGETDAAVADGLLYTASGALTALIGRPATTLSAAVGAALRTKRELAAGWFMIAKTS